MRALKLVHPAPAAAPEVCGFCGEPATRSPCPNLYRERIVVLPPELHAGDTWKATDGKLYSMRTIAQTAPEEWELGTVQGPLLHVYHDQLPLLVGRWIVCNGPRCDLHCAACMERAGRQLVREPHD